jgi:hypothetical protein
VARKTLPSNSQKQASGLQSWRFEALVFSTNFRLGFEIAGFQAVLPKNLIHHVQPNEPIHDFIESWKRAARETSHAKTFGLRQWFVSAAQKLADKGFDVDLRKKWLSKGWLIWKL